MSAATDIAPALAPETSVRIHVRAPLVEGTVEVDRLVPIFHRWIRERALDDQPLVDVSNYSHVTGGGLLLITRDGHYAVDALRGAWGASYQRRRGGPSDPQARLHDALSRLDNFTALLAKDAGLEVEPGAVEIGWDDRLRAPNTFATFSAVEPFLKRGLASFGRPTDLLEWSGASGRTFTVLVRAPYTGV